MENDYHLFEDGFRMLLEESIGGDSAMLLDSSGILIWNDTPGAAGAWTDTSSHSGTWVEA